MSELTQDRLKELLEYDLGTGLFTRLVSTKAHNVGSLAGYLGDRGYFRIFVDGKLYLTHRLTFLYVEGEFPPNFVDHINGVTNDNRWCNLRHATRTENIRNQVRRKDNTSGYKGVHWLKISSKWIAKIKYGGKTNHLGCFDCKHEAAKSYNDAAIRHHGEFAKLNEIKTEGK